MARTRKTEEQQQTNESVPHGEGGVFVIGEDGVRRLVERTENQVIRSVDEANAPPADETAGE